MQQKSVCRGGGAGETKYYTGMVDAFLKIFRHEGAAGLYKGFVPGLCGVLHGAIQFMAYEELKNRYNIYREKVEL